MSPLIWKQEYCVGNDLIDTQHRGLLGLLNQLEQALAAGQSGGLELDVLTELVRYANDHFSTEEELMKQAAYPGRWEHERSHLEFRENLARLAGRIMQGDVGGWPSLLDFVHAWWQEHILGSDREVFLYCSRANESHAGGGI